MPRRAFTMIELLLVLALVVIIGALVTPIMSRTLQNQRLRYAGDQLRAEWLHARSTAMKSGRIQMFRYQPETSYYKFETWVAENDDLEASADADNPTAVGPSTTTPLDEADLAADPSLADARELPGEVKFVDSEVFNDTRAAEIDAEVPSASPTAASGAGGWSRPILFYPDGTSSAARVVVRNENYYVLLNLRGLTGSAVASDLLTLEGVSNATQQ